MRNTKKVNEFLNVFLKECDTHTGIKDSVRKLICDQISRGVDVYDYDLSDKQIILLNSIILAACDRYGKELMRDTFFQEVSLIISFIITCGEANKRLERDLERKEKEFQGAVSRIEQD